VNKDTLATMYVGALIGVAVWIAISSITGTMSRVSSIEFRVGSLEFDRAQRARAAANATPAQSGT
jgi:hypothetical protein